MKLFGDGAIPATWGVIGAATAAHVCTALVHWHRGRQSLLVDLLLPRPIAFRVNAGGQFHPLVASGQLWRLCTCVLLHGDALHLTVNLVSLWTLGRLLEPEVGGLRWLSWFVLGGLGGSALSQAVGVLESDGASGGAFCLLTAATVIAWRLRADADDRRLFRILLGFVVVNTILSFALPFVDAAGHVGGLLVGLGLGAAWRGPRQSWPHLAVIAMFVAGCAYGWGRWTFG